MEVVDFAQGFGAVQLSSTLPTESSPGEAFFHDNSLSSDDIYYYLIYVNDPSEELSMTTAWYDPPSTVSAYNVSLNLVSYGSLDGFYIQISIWKPKFGFQKFYFEVVVYKIEPKRN